MDPAGKRTPIPRLPREPGVELPDTRSRAILPPEDIMALERVRIVMQDGMVANRNLNGP